MAGGRSIEQGERARDDATATYAGSPERYVTQLLDTLRQQLDDYCSAVSCMEIRDPSRLVSTSRLASARAASRLRLGSMVANTYFKVDSSPNMR